MSNCEITGYSSGLHQDYGLVIRAIASVTSDLRKTEFAKGTNEESYEQLDLQIFDVERQPQIQSSFRISQILEVFEVQPGDMMQGAGFLVVYNKIRINR